jgi:hypothetical protein
MVTDPASTTHLQVMISVDHLNLLLVTSQICLFLFTPYWLWMEGWGILMGSTLRDLKLSTIELQHVMLKLLGASILNAVQTVSAFTFLSLVPPVTYSVANVTKRVAIISLSIVYFGQTATFANVCDHATTYSGVDMGLCVCLEGRGGHTWSGWGGGRGKESSSSVFTAALSLMPTCCA